LLDDGFTHFIETSAHPVLTPGITDTIDTHPTTNPHTTTVTGTLRRNDATLTRFLTNAAHTWTTGLPLTWTTHNSQVQPLELPLDEPAEAKGARPSGADLEERRFWRMVEQQDGQELAGLLGLGQEADRASLEAVLPVLSGWWQRHRENTAVNDWRYRIAWRPVPADAPRAALTGTWFLVVPRQLAGPEVSDLAAACGRSIDEHGGKAVVIAVDASAENLTEVTDALTASADQPVGGVLSLLALDESPHPDHPVIPSGLVATVRLMQAMENAGCDARLWSATSGAVSTASGDELSHPVQAHLWGLNRVAGLENPHRFAGLVDLPPALDDTTGALLCSALAGIGDEDQLAVRDNGIHVRRLVRASLDNTQPSSPWQPSGTTLITGGTGALGGHVARWLSRKGAHVLLLSRRGPDAPGAEELRGELTELGAASVTITACDIADEDALAGVIGAIPADRPLTAVIHTAGVVDDGPVNEMTAEQLERVLLPKTRAVENLHRLTEDHDLSAFVLYSSYGNLLPNVGQGAYAAGNAYLDAFARHRRAAGRPATSIAWGAWAGKGMAEDQGFIDWLSLGGMDLMTPHLGVMALQQALDHDDTFVAIANVDWERFAERFNTTRPHPLVSELVTPHTAATAAPAPRETTEAVRLADLPEAQRKSELLRLVCAELATVLGYSGTQDIDPDVAFKELGIDSVTAIEFRNRINAVTGLRFSPVSVFDHPTSEALTEHLLSRMPRPEGTTPGEGTAPQQQVRKDSEDKEVEEGAAREAQPGGSRIDSMALEDLVRMARGANGS
ncbi:SDR family NAD(P)-dependent oxidoreductase, partial [Streptomyces sp. I05A-00742]|uniref:SDR family NAD(P)-dependent oxidoreductase n=1 Tax=Streptomyces sp. I05A-00742 TaxID=2732853 RepID=UPI001489A9A8